MPNYVQFEIRENVLEADIAPIILMIKRSVSKTRGCDDGVTVCVKYLYVITHRVLKNSAITTNLDSIGLFKVMFQAARKFVIDNRPHNPSKCVSCMVPCS
jgi:hypothetical protein